MLVSRRKLLRLAAPAIILAARPRLARAMQLVIADPLAFPSGLAPGFNYAHPAAKGLLFSGVPSLNGNFTNLLTGAAGTNTGTPTAGFWGPVGPVTKYAASATQTNFTFPTTSYTLGVTAAIAYTTGANSVSLNCICGDSNGSNVGLGLDFDWNETPGDMAVRLAGTYYDLGPTTAPLVANVPYFFAVSAAGSTLSYWVVTRLDTGSILSGTLASTAGPGTGTGTFSVGGRSDGTANRQVNGGVAAAMRANTSLTLAQLIAWAERPWDFWYPPSDVEAELVGTIASSTAGEGSLMQMGIGQ